jgi:uncharacterized protein
MVQISIPYLHHRMIRIGKFNILEVKTISSIGLYLTDGEEDVLLPTRFVRGRPEKGDELKVFVYLDNDNRPVATTEEPFAELEQFAFLKVNEVNQHGAFLDWGISRDLFVAFSEQRKPMVPGESYLVYIFLDEISGRIAATTRWSQFTEAPVDLKTGDEVELLIAEKTDLGWRAIINNAVKGMLYENEIFQPLHEGDMRRGYIRQIRPDGKVDLRLQPEGYSNVEISTNAVLQYLKTHNGLLPLGDKSPAEEIYKILRMSKKTFKKTVGALYKQRLISIADNETRLITEE